MRALKAAAGEAAGTLDERLKRARLHIDELSVLTGSGERIADRIERGVSAAPRSVAAGRHSAAVQQHHEPPRQHENRAMILPPKIRPRFVRLLPSVMLVGARPSGAEGVRASCMTPMRRSTSPRPPTRWRRRRRRPTRISPATMPRSPAPSEVDVLTSLSKRRGELDAREAKIQIQANILAATEARVDAKIAQLKSLQTQITALLAQRDAAQEKQIAVPGEDLFGDEAQGCRPHLRQPER